MSQTEKTNRGWHQDRERVSGIQPHELEYIRKHYCKNTVSIKEVRAVFDSINDGAVMRSELMQKLNEAGLIHHDSTDGHEPGGIGHEGEAPETPTE